MQDVSTRFGILDRLNDNWPGKFPQSRLAFLERELRQFDNETLRGAVTAVLRGEHYPPTVNALWYRCKALEPRTQTDESNLLYPGGPVPGGAPGERFLTADEAAEELERMREEYPDAFEPIHPSDRIKTMEDTSLKYKMMLGVHRIYIRGLEACVKNDNRPIEATQQVMF
jgi:hypothetical protein